MATLSFPGIGTDAMKWLFLILASLLAGVLGVYLYGVLAPPTHNIGELFAFGAAGLVACIVTFVLGWLFFVRHN
jgi:hypothetical protein